MNKYLWFSALLSLVAIALLPIHAQAIAHLGSKGWIDMAFGLPIGLMTALNVTIIVNKIAPRK